MAIKLGLIKGQVELYDHDAGWIENAKQTATFLKAEFGSTVVDVQHVGSTAIMSIKAKPIIDIIVGISDFKIIKGKIPTLLEAGIIHRPNNDQPEYMMFVIGDMDKEIRIRRYGLTIFMLYLTTGKNG